MPTRMLVAGPNLTIDRTGVLRELRPGSVLRLEHVVVTPGGKGLNVARAARALGMDALLVGFVPGATGRAGAGMIAREGIALRGVPCAGELRSTTVVMERDGRTTVLNEPGPEITAADWEAYEAAIAEEIGAHGVLVCSGSVPPGSPDDAYARLAAIAARAGRRCVVDAAGTTLVRALEACPDVVCPNVAEAEEALGAAAPASRAGGEPAPAAPGSEAPAAAEDEDVGSAPAAADQAPAAAPGAASVTAADDPARAAAPGAASVTAADDPAPAAAPGAAPMTAADNEAPAAAPGAESVTTAGDARPRAEAAAAALVARGARAALVTADAAGAALATGDGAIAWLPAPRIEHVRNPVGAGDVLASALAAALERGEPLLEAARRGVAAAAASVESPKAGELDPARAAELLG